MDLTDLPVFGAIHRRMKWLNKRQSVLAENIANSNTPGFAARDLKPQDFRELMRGESDKIHMVRTDSSHTAGTLESSNLGGDTRAKRSANTLPSGNSVNLEEEMVKVTDTQIEYQAVTALYRKQIGLLKVALGKGR